MHRFILSFIVLLGVLSSEAQIFDDFSDGNFNENPVWFGDTTVFDITNSSAIPPEMKPALRLQDDKSDTASIVLANSLSGAIEWSFWTKLSFNSSGSNYLRVYLISDGENLESDVSAYFLQVGGADDEVSIVKQEGQVFTTILTAADLTVGNSTNVFRFRIIKDSSHEWNLYADSEGGNNYVWQGSVVEENTFSNNYFGLSCYYTSSNATKFYFDDFSVNFYEEDLTPPVLLSKELIDDNKIKLKFDEALNEGIAENVSHYFCDNGITNPIYAEYSSSDNSVLLTFDYAFETNLLYHLTITDIEDIFGNVMLETIIEFELMETVEGYYGDVVISEIMADVNPAPNNLPNKDYLELYNATEDNIQLAGWSIRLKESGEFISIPPFILPPDTFLIVTKTTDVTLFESYGLVLGLSGFSLNNEAKIILRNSNDDLIDSEDYNKNWYHDEEKENGGWSMEMVDLSKACYGENNWRASVNLDGGTPGKSNSVEGEYFEVPEILDVIVASENSIKIQFNHLMNLSQSLNQNAYLLEPESVNPVQVVSNEDMSVDLIFLSNFASNTNYTLSIVDTIMDCSGYFIPINESFEILIPTEADPYDVLFTELMPDPSPAIGLPEYEYIELVNHSEKIISLEGWTLMIGETEKLFSSVVLLPNQYLILCSEEASIFFQWSGDVYAFPSLTLPNSGQQLQLFDQNNTLINQLIYSSDWYDLDKNDGGWSLEMKNLELPCSGESNWGSCIADEGGTPGTVNSLFTEEPLAVGINSIVVENPQKLALVVDQIYQTESVEDVFNYTIEPEIGIPLSVTTSEENPFLLEVELVNPLQYKVLYQFVMNGDMENCAGDTISVQDTAVFGLAEIPEVGDILISEVLFNPRNDGVDFVEIYNNSDKYIDVGKLALGYVKTYDFEPNDTLFKPATENSHLIYPYDYMVFTKNPKIVEEQYYVKNPEAFVMLPSFPTYNNEAGTVLLKNEEDIYLDIFTYHEDMHFALLNSVDGVSLERISMVEPTADISNWHSAAETVGYATPTYENSQSVEIENIDIPVSISPEIFSPDNDGYEDVATINYNFDQGGYVANVIIFDSKGRFVTHLKRNVLLETKGSFYWNGIMDNHERASDGIYIVLFQVFNLDKEVKKYKLAVSIGSK